ncbi:hypothetical protein Megpolyxen_01754 (plasmid) [Candidatus Megaera polyxenophila]|nr:hypothetical protein Megpolyxen_01754 [Candidatus Megaera polyxenophila]
MNKQNYTAIFSHYIPINYEPYYVFTTDKALLVKCNDYPDLNAYEKVNLAAEIQKICKDGVILKNVEWRPADE